MATRRVNRFRVKTLRTYTSTELADCLVVHKNTVRAWNRSGLAPIDDGRPMLFEGAVVRDFLAKRKADQKRPCPPGTLFCLRCRAPRAPALGMVDYRPLTPETGNLRAFCETCEGVMHRRARHADLPRILPGFAVRNTDRPASIGERSAPSLNCDQRKD